MSTRKSLAACAALLFGIFQGCQSEASLATAADRSSEGNGTVAFRLSENSVSILNQSSYELQIKIFGPGMDTFWRYDAPRIDPIVMENIPAGTRIVEVSAVNWQGLPTWMGRDTVVVNPGAYTTAKIMLTRQAPRYGTLVLDLDIDTSRLSDSLDPRDPVDTVWQIVRYPSTWGNYTYTYCNSPKWKNANSDSLLVNCYEVRYETIPGDTIWQDTVVHQPVGDTTFWCRLDKPLDSSSWNDTSRVTYRCYRPRYEAPIDTLWQDTISWSPVDSMASCNATSWSEFGTQCTRWVYRPNFVASNCYTQNWETSHSLHTYICTRDSSSYDSLGRGKKKKSK